MLGVLEYQIKFILEFPDFLVVTFGVFLLRLTNQVAYRKRNWSGSSGIVLAQESRFFMERFRYGKCLL